MSEQKLTQALIDIAGHVQGMPVNPTTHEVMRIIADALEDDLPSAPDGDDNDVYPLDMPDVKQCDWCKQYKLSTRKQYDRNENYVMDVCADCLKAD